jgi:hypothetical protein
MPNAAYGLGYPFFNFYASLPYYLAAALKLLGFGYIASIKAVQALGFVLSALAMYGLGRELRQSHTASLVAALVYACAPFHLVNVYVRGDSLSEFYAFVFFPLILWSLTRLHRRPSARNAAWVGLSFAGLILSHNLSAVIFSPFTLLYVLLLAAKAPAASLPRWQAVVKSLALSAAALALGALLSAWFWLPALGETAHVDLRDMTTGYFHFGQHFRAADLVQRSLLFDYAITAEQEPFRMGLLQGLLAVAGGAILVATWLRQRRVDADSAFVALLTIGATLMVTPLSRPLWERIPLLPMVQFPWRFLSVQAVGTSLLAAYLVPLNPRLKQGVALVIAVLVLASAMGTLQPERLYIGEADVNTERLALYEYFTANIGTTIRADWLPAGVVPRPYTSEALWHNAEKPVPLVLEGQVSLLERRAQGPTSEGWTIDVMSPEAVLAFHTYHFPGWQAQVDGVPATIDALPGLGYIGLRLGTGRHQVRLQLGGTPARSAGELVSAVAAAVVLFALLRGMRVSQGTVAVAAATLAAPLLLSVTPQALPFSPQPDETRLDLTMDLGRVPYLHHNPGGVAFGSATRMSHYAISAQEIYAGESLAVTAYWEDVRADDLVADVALVSPAQHLFDVPLVEASDAKPLTTERTQHTLRVPASAPRGFYLLTLRVHDSEEEVLPVNARGEDLGTTHLLPIRVRSHNPASGDEPVVQAFGERIVLSQVETEQRVVGTLEVTLTWRTDGPPPRNYKTALRLRDPSGWEVGRLDTQPGYGFYPTHMWRPGELVRDRYLLPLDEGTPPGAAYQLDVTLYEAASLHPLATAHIADIEIRLPTVQPGLSGAQRIVPAIALAEARTPSSEWEQGATVPLWVKWVATDAPDVDYRVEVSLHDVAAAAVQRQAFPLAHGYRSSLWPKDALVASRYAVELPPEIPAGEYAVALTVIDPTTGEAAGTLRLSSPLHIVEAARDFDIPPMSHAVGADFGQLVRLLGYDLQETPTELQLALHWQALSQMDTDYKVFVHLFDPQTETIARQQDRFAGGEGYGTARWLPQEVVRDELVLALGEVPRGDYRLAVGVYHAGGRLPVVAPPSFTVSADRLLLSEAIRIP